MQKSACKAGGQKADSRKPERAAALLRLNLEQIHGVEERTEGGLRRDPDIVGLTFKHGDLVAHILAPDDIELPLPLLLVLHGAGKNKIWSPNEQNGQEWAEGLQVVNWAQWAKSYKMLVLYPEARNSTWDYVKSGGRQDIDFIELSMNTVRKAFPIDDSRIATVGISDGGSMALSLAVHNANIFQAAISSSAGFCASPPAVSRTGCAPQIFMIHGSEDKMFPLERTGFALRDTLQRAGYKLDFRVAQGQGHIPHGWQLEFLSAWLSMGSASTELAT